MKNQESLVEKAYRHIKHMFFMDQLVGGQKLRYQDLAQRLGMSQTPVIQALTRLEYEGLVRSEANKGYFVQGMDLNEADELYDMRLLIEPFLLPRVLANLGPAEIKELSGLIKEHRESRRAVYRRQRLMADARFHLVLAAYSGHQTAVEALRRVIDHIYLKCRAEQLPRARLKVAEAQHLELMEALKAGKAAVAGRLLSRHIQEGRQHILEGLSRSMQEPEQVIL